MFGSGFGYSPKSNQYVLVTHPACLPSLVRIRSHVLRYHMIYHFQPYPSMVNNYLKMIGSGSGFRSSPKLNRFFPVTHPMCPPIFVKIVNNFLRYHAIYRFWLHLSMVKNHFLKKILVSRFTIRIVTKNE